jgi:hypothetical protein
LFVSGYNFIYVEIIRRGQSPQLVERIKCTRIAIYPLFDIFITEGCLLISGSFVAKVLIHHAIYIMQMSAPLRQKPQSSQGIFASD